MDIFNSFEMFEERFGIGSRYATIPLEQLDILKHSSLPPFYIKYIEENGLKEFNNGFWWFLNPLELNSELSFVTHTKTCFPVIRNAFGGFIVFIEGEFYLASIQTKNFVLLGKELGVIANISLTDDYALRDMHFAEFFNYAFAKFGKLAADEIYAFVPAPAIGGEFKNGNIQVVKLREYLNFLAQL
ncbi:T6SS immunity protein Tdi1 domain-containing protein [Methylobacter sp.]|jgi:hypothetical protein|uniref:T6SS immunity protein Tdi1 domain-containing protein n=1 Tax=Methylobacter sp. TaxID=2051955 RepID=UPI003DA4A4EF